MSTESQNLRGFFTSEFLDAGIKLGVIAALTFLCLRVVSPFVYLMIFGLILAVSLYPMHQALVKKTPLSNGWGAALIAGLGVVLLGTPVVMIGISFAEHIIAWEYTNSIGSLELPPPPESINAWPIIGERLQSAWASAVSNFPAFLRENKDTIGQLGQSALSAVSDSMMTIIFLMASFSIAGIMMAYGSAGTQVMTRILNKVAGVERGGSLQKLSVATVRSVGVGVIGVAFIQAVLHAIVFLIADIPAAGVLAVIVLLVGIVQLPAVIISIPVIAYIWIGGDAGMTGNIIYTVLLVLAGLSDNVLKPLLLGRGVDAPMPIILIGALGGMVATGFVGLFLGAVVLAVSYRIFMNWVDSEAEA